MKATRTIWALALLLLTASAQGQIGSPVPAILTLETGTRPAGIGECYVAVADDAWAAFWNPGGLPFVVERVSASVMYSSLVPDWGGLDYLSSAVVLRTEELGAFSVSWSHFSYGEVPVDPFGSETMEAWESTRSIGYGLAPLADFGVGLNVTQATSLVLPPIDEGSRDTISRATVFDVGVLYRFRAEHGPWKALYRLGAVGQHLGGSALIEDFDLADPSEPPRRLRLGASCLLRGDPFAEVLLCMEYKRSINSTDSMYYTKEPVLGFGLELRTMLNSVASVEPDAEPADVLAVRLGYVHNEEGELKGFSFGFGITLNTAVGPVSLDFANVPQAEGLSRPWRIGGSVGIGT